MFCKIFRSNIEKSISMLCTFQCLKNRAMEQLGVTVSAIGIKEIVGPDMVSFTTKVVQRIGKLMPKNMTLLIKKGVTPSGRRR